LHNEYAIDLTRRTPMDVTRGRGPRLFQVRVAALVVFDLLVLFAIGAAVVRYVEWSSDAALAEFLGAPSNQSPQRPKLNQPVKSRKTCSSKT
jgi:hypothetical protein